MSYYKYIPKSFLTSTDTKYAVTISPPPLEFKEFYKLIMDIFYFFAPRSKFFMIHEKDDKGRHHIHGGYCSEMKEDMPIIKYLFASKCHIDIRIMKNPEGWYKYCGKKKKFNETLFWNHTDRSRYNGLTGKYIDVLSVQHEFGLPTQRVIDMETGLFYFKSENNFSMYSNKPLITDAWSIQKQREIQERYFKEENNEIEKFLSGLVSSEDSEPGILIPVEDKNENALL